jgi:sugar lactone lactonase YvrE
MKHLHGFIPRKQTRARKSRTHATAHHGMAGVHLSLVLFALFAPATLVKAQTSVSRIHTLAGGGTNSSTAVSALIARPVGVAVDSAGNFYAASGPLRQVYRVDSSGNLTAVAGNGVEGPAGDGGPATSASLLDPLGLAVDSGGNLFIADVSRIARVDASTGIITAVAGNGTYCPSPTDPCGDGGPATSASLNFARGVAVDGSGDVYIADSQNNRIRRVDAATGVITTVAGNGTRGFSGDGGPATSAELTYPYEVAVDTSGNLFIADQGNSRIRRVDAATKIITTVAGGGTPTSGVGDGGPATSARLRNPQGVALDTSGNLLIADTFDQRVRRVDGATGIITTVAGNGTPGFSGDGGPATSASLHELVGVAISSSGNLFIADQYNNRVRRVAASTGIITTAAGGGTGGDGGPATSGVLPEPLGVAVDGSGNVFTSTFGDSRVRRVDGSIGTITTAAGSSVAGFSGDGGPAISAQLFFPYGVAVDTSGNLFVADLDNFRVRRVDAATGVIATVAGSDNFCNPTDPCGDGGPATGAFVIPYGVTVDSSGNLLVADGGDYRIRQVDATTGIITTVAGDGYSTGEIDGPGGNPADDLGDGGLATAATFECPEFVAVDGSGNLFISDDCASRVRRVDAATGIITTFAGNGTYGFSGDGGPATSASLAYPEGMVFDSSGNLLIVDSGNSRVRRVDAATGIITTVVGSGTFGFSGDGGPATSAELSDPFGIALDSAGNLYIADTASNRIRVVTPPSGVALSPSSLSFSNQSVGTTSNPQNVTLTNSGAASLTITSITIAGDDSEDFTQTNTCGTSLASGASCTVSVTFKPTATGTRNAGLTFTDDASDSPQVVALTGTGTAPTASLSPASLPFGDQVVGTSSGALAVTISNGGDAALTISGITIGGANSGDFAVATSGTTCSTSSAVAAGGSCTVAVSFTPTASGSRSATLTLADNALNAPQTVALSGTGADFSVAPASGSTTSATVTAGGTATFSLTIAPSGLTGDVSFTCAVSPSGPTCSVSPSSLTLDGKTPANITVSVGTTAPSLAPPVASWPRWPGLPVTGLVLLGLLLVWRASNGTADVAAPIRACPEWIERAPWRAKARRYGAAWSLASLAALLMCVGFWAGCGGGGATSASTQQSTTTTGTPAGTYTITVTGTSGNLSRNTTLTLTVN